MFFGQLAQCSPCIPQSLHVVGSGSHFGQKCLFPGRSQHMRTYGHDQSCLLHTEHGAPHSLSFMAKAYRACSPAESYVE
jgi:hypothetical protein